MSDFKDLATNVRNQLQALPILEGELKAQLRTLPPGTLFRLGDSIGVLCHRWFYDTHGSGSIIRGQEQSMAFYPSTVAYQEFIHGHLTVANDLVIGKDWGTCQFCGTLRRINPDTSNIVGHSYRYRGGVVEYSCDPASPAERSMDAITAVVCDALGVLGNSKTKMLKAMLVEGEIPRRGVENECILGPLESMETIMKMYRNLVLVHRGVLWPIDTPHPNELSKFWKWYTKWYTPAQRIHDI